MNVDLNLHLSAFFGGHFESSRWQPACSYVKLTKWYRTSFCELKLNFNSLKSVCHIHAVLFQWKV